jgi:hypothetical protein
MSGGLILMVVFLCSSGLAVETVEELDELAVFNFVVMSDNKGDAPGGNGQHMARLVQWTEDAGSSFILGLGDHVKIGRDNPFLEFIQSAENPDWRDHFYPNVADGENEYWGSGQADWGAGAPMFDYVNLADRTNVELRENRVEYYANMEVEGFTVHVIQVHFSDSPSSAIDAFREDSRQWMMDRLEAIDKTEKDIIVVLGHSRNGNFPSVLSQARLDILMSKADLLLSATTHAYRRWTYNGYENSGVLSLNSGAVGTAGNGNPNGFLHIYVLDNPFRLVSIYQRTDSEGYAGREYDARELHDGNLSYMVEEGVITEEIDWSALQPVGIQVKGHTFQNDDITVGSSRFGPDREIEFFVSEKSLVTLSLYDGRGAFIENVYRKVTSPGIHTVDWDTSPYQPGIYYLKGSAGGNKLVKKIVLIR